MTFKVVISLLCERILSIQTLKREKTIFFFLLVVLFVCGPLSSMAQNTRDTRGTQNRGTLQRRGGTTAQRTGTTTQRGRNVVKNNKNKDDKRMLPNDSAQLRWKVQKTVPREISDLDEKSTDLKRPDNLQNNVYYNDSLNFYYIGSKLGDSYINAPIIMTPEEYLEWSTKKSMYRYFRTQNQEQRETKGKEKFDFTDMHFDLGPAEKIFGPGGVRVKTQGSAELKFGATHKKIDNPSLALRNRSVTQMDFDMKINMNMKASVGDKMNMNLNYNTDATFDYDTKNIKLKYEGKEDEIIKLVEGGNVSFPSNSSLVQGATSLFGLRTDLQFGKLKLQTVVSQKNSTSKTVSSKGGTQLTTYEFDATEYEQNRHFFLSEYFRDKYDASMATLPNVTSGITINRVEVWVTNKTATTTNTRNLLVLTDLGENSSDHVSSKWTTTGQAVPSNSANTSYSEIKSYPGIRQVDNITTTMESEGLTGGTDFEKLESARLLTSSEYTLNSYLGYISLKTTLQTDQVLAVAYEYTYRGQVYQVGEFAADITSTDSVLIVKSLKNTDNNPTQHNWNLMMKNVYQLASSIEKTKFKLDIKYLSDSSGVYVNYIPNSKVKSTKIIRAIGADRLNSNNKTYPDGYFDFIEGYTVSEGRVFLPKAEPFGDALREFLTKNGLSQDSANYYCFQSLYDSTRTVAKQDAEKNKFLITGQYSGTSGNVISLGSYNVPQGSVTVTAAGTTLTEGVDYTVDYNAGEVTIINQSIIDAGTNISVSTESNTDYGQMRKTMLGVNWEYDVNKDLQFSGTIQHLSEQALTSKVALGSEPLNNTIWGVNVNWKKESQWLTNMLDKLPFLHCTQPSQIQFTGEFAQLIAKSANNTQDNASYIDDFENTTNGIDISNPKSWTICSVPKGADVNYNNKTTVAGGYKRALLAWYNIDPLFTRSYSSLTPSYIKSDLDQLSNHYVREVYTAELFPTRRQTSYSGQSNTVTLLNLAYYPSERGPYNLSTDLNYDGTLQNPENNWGGMMCKLNTTDFENANVQYIEFWLMDPFVYTRDSANVSDFEGKLYIDLGDVSEDILCDGKKFYESGMPVDDNSTTTFTTTVWGKIPNTTTTTYAFATSSGSRAKQDVGFNGLTDAEEQTYGAYAEFLEGIRGKVSDDVYQTIYADPANDDYHYFRGSDFDEARTSILDRYKRINNPQGNSPDNESQTEGYDTSYKSTPDVEDINQDYTLNEYESFYRYEFDLDTAMMNVGENFIVEKKAVTWKLRNGTSPTVNWYLVRIPIDSYNSSLSTRTTNDFTSIRFMRMFLTGFKKPVVMRLGEFQLVRGEWRVYNKSLETSTGTGTITASSVSYEENGNKEPVNYILPPGITRSTDPTQPQLVENDEKAMCLVVNDLSNNEAKAMYKKTTLDIRQYQTIQMFTHANALEDNTTNLSSGELAVFVRLGSDYKNNYYEYQIPLTLTPASSSYSNNSSADRLTVWPNENMMNISLKLFTAVKKHRNAARSSGTISSSEAYYEYDPDNPQNKVTIVGNPSLGGIKTMMIGVRNLSSSSKSGEVWVNELRLIGYDNEGGWAANANLNVQLSDIGNVNVQGSYMTAGFGGLEQGILERSMSDDRSISLTTSLELGKFFPDKAKVTIPFYYSMTKTNSRPKYNPLDTDVLLDDALDAATTKEEKDSIENIAVTRTTVRNLSFSNVNFGVRFNKAVPLPLDPANFTFTYSHAHEYQTGETTVYERTDNWKGILNYSYSPVYKTWKPFEKAIKSKSKWYDFPKALGINYLPQNISFNSEILRNYYEYQERDIENLEENSSIPVTFSEQFLWNRSFALRWDFTPNIHMSFNSTTNAEIEEPYTPINKDLYPDQYDAWKDSVWTSIKHFGRPLTYSQNFSLSYQLPLNKIPAFDWVTSNANYTSTYGWARGTETDSIDLGNTINNYRDININGSFNMETLYNKVPFLAAVNKKYNQRQSNTALERRKRMEDKKAKVQEKKGKKGDSGKQDDKEKEKKELPKNKNTFEKEIVMAPDSQIVVSHGKNSKRISVTARTLEGHTYKVKFKKKDANTIVIKPTGDSIPLKLMVKVKPKLEETKWYKIAQAASRVMMMVRSVNVSYRDQYSMTLPGFIPEVGNAFGQKTGGALKPGLDFAFGLVGDSYIQKALDNDWLITDTTYFTSPATTSATQDLQIRMSLEPIKDLKIELSATRNVKRNKSIPFVYGDNGITTHSGSFTMTTVSLGGSLEAWGDANNSFYSAKFEDFCNSLDGFRDRVEAQYTNAIYPNGTSAAGQRFSTENGTVDKYSGDVLIPAFLNTYTSSGDGLNLFPSLRKLLPNWTMKYTGLSYLPWFRDHFKSVTLSHGYKSVYSVGSYSSYNTFREYMDGLGFITSGTSGELIPSTMYNISTVSLNEAFSPLFGVDLTFFNNMTLKAEYRTARVLALSMTSVQLNQTSSKDFVVGAAYKINNFNLFSKRKRRVKSNSKSTNASNKRNEKTSAAKSGFNTALSLRFDLTYRRQASITRDIRTVTSSASSGSTAWKWSLAAEYAYSRLLTFTAYYDGQSTNPLLSSSSYPTVTQDFGVSLKFSLTR